MRLHNTSGGGTPLPPPEQRTPGQQKRSKNEEVDSNTSFKNMILLSIATSIDAFAVGITFSFFKINILFSIFIIGFTTFCISFIGVLLGNNIGNKNQRKAKILGGIILIILGIKILFEHLNLLI